MDDEKPDQPEKPEESEQPARSEQTSHIDLEQILTPISEANPVGIDLRDDGNSEYYSLKKIRNDLRKQEQNELLEGGTGAKIKWNEVIKVATDILAKKSKDLEVAAWLVEALLREDRFAGLGDGVEMLIGLVDQYWDVLYPREEGDFEVTIAPIEGLSGATRDGVLIKPLYMLPIVTFPDGRSILTWDYIKAYDLFSNSVEASSEVHAGVASLDDLKTRCEPLDAKIFIDKKVLIEKDIQYFIQLYDLLKIKTEAKWRFSFSTIEGALTKCIEVLHFLGEFAFEDTQGTIVDPKLQQKMTSKSRYVVSNIEEVGISLKAVEKFYRNNHPHSPMASLIKRASDWSKMSLAELIPQILNDSQSQMEYCRMVGLDPNTLVQVGGGSAGSDQYDDPYSDPQKMPDE